MKKIFCFSLLLLFLGVLVSCNKEEVYKTYEGSEETQNFETEEVFTETFLETTVEELKKEYGKTIYHELDNASSRELRKAFNFFWGTANLDKDTLGYGLIPDRYPGGNNLSSIASVGFGLAAYAIGVNNGFISYDKAYERTLLTLDTLLNLKVEEGFFYHFYYMNSALEAPNSEISIIDTGILLCGALTAGKYFGLEVEKKALELYDRVNWEWYLNPNTLQFYMGYDPVKKQHFGRWDFYAEQLMLYFLAAGSKTHPLGIDVYNSFKKEVGRYGDYELIYSWFGSLFTYQFSHAFIDFRKMVDNNGINWFLNSKKATYANYQYAIDHHEVFKTMHEKSFGMTACDGPKGYSGKYGASPSGAFNSSHQNDGTVSLAGAIGSICFAPEIVIPAINYYYETLDGKLFGPYGFYDSYNLENDVWIAKDVIGIDKGISLLMLENYRSELIWEIFMDCNFMKEAIKVLKFQTI